MRPRSWSPSFLSVDGPPRRSRNLDLRETPILCYSSSTSCRVTFPFVHAPHKALHSLDDFSHSMGVYGVSQAPLRAAEFLKDFCPDGSIGAFVFGTLISTCLLGVTATQAWSELPPGDRKSVV